MSLPAPPGRWLCAVLVSAALLAACAPEFVYDNTDAPSHLAEEAVGAPVRMIETMNWPVVEAEINGQSGFRLLLDTGATPTVLVLHENTERLALQSEGEVSIHGAGSGEGASSGLASGIDLKIGGAEISDLTVLTLPWSNLPLFSDEEGVFFDGIIGYDLFSRFGVDIDPGSEAVRFYPSGEGPDWPDAIDLELYVKDRMAVTDISIQAEAETAPVSLQVTIDTGNTNTLAVREGADPAFALAAKSGTPSSSAGIQGEMQDVDLKAEKLVMGEAVIPGLPLMIATEMPDIAAHDGLLGNGALRKFAHLIDYEAGLLRLRPLEQPLTPIGKDWAGFVLVPGGMNAETFRVLLTDAGSPADRAGFGAGDVIISIDGVPVSDISALRLRERFSDADSDPIEVCRLGDASGDPACFDIAPETG